MNIPFKGFLPDRPYPATGLTTARWKTEVDAMPVYLSDLYLTQQGVYIAPLFGLADLNGNGSTDIYPHVVAWNGELYLEDGHTRVVRQALAGTRVMRMRVYKPRYTEPDAA
jgi:hypothetical protein